MSQDRHCPFSSPGKPASPAAVSAGEGAGDLHKRDVAGFFSSNTAYWQSVYEPGGMPADLVTVAMANRKEIVIREVDRYAGKTSLKLLDAGCGPGIILEEMVRRGHQIAGIDISEEMVREANDRLGKYLPGQTVCRQGDLENLPFADESMDVVLCLGVLPYLRHDEPGIRELSRVLKKGGLGVLVQPNLFKLGNFLDPYYYLCRIWHLLGHRFLHSEQTGRGQLNADDFGRNRQFGIRRYTLNQLDRLLARYHLEKICSIGVDYGPLTMWQRAILPERVSIGITRFLCNAARRYGFSWVKTLANQWVITLKKA